MEQQNKYYTPDISELHVGYECEFNDQENWETFTINDRSTLFVILRDMEINEESPIRTKYLDKSNVESLGWVYSEKYKNYCLKEVYKLSWWNLSDKWAISYYNEIIYIGNIKSINELRKIMQWLNIK